MSEFGNMDPNDPLRRSELSRDYPPDDSMSSNATWGWVAAAVFVAVVLFIAFTSGREGTQTASNEMSQPPASSRITTPPANPAPTTTPGPTAPAAQPPTDQTR